jgi:DNA-binding beta-propeller fold protein YncE
MRPAFALGLVLICSAGPMSGAARDTTAFRLIQTIPLPGVEGRIDHFALDRAGERLFVCALGNNSVEVLDLRQGKRVHTIAGLGSPQGIAYIPGFDRLFVANDKGGACKLFDGKSFQQRGQIGLNDDADNVRYDAAAKKLYVGFGNGGIAVINQADGKEVTRINLAGHPEAFELEKDGTRIFVNVPDARQVAVVDRLKGQVVTAWGTGKAFGNFPMAFDEAGHRLFVGCRSPSELLVFNSDSGEIVSKLGISADADELFYDAKRHRIYAICGAGKLDIIDQVDLNTYKLVNSRDTAKGARTGLFVAERDELFVAVPRRGSQEAEVRLYHID